MKRKTALALLSAGISIFVLGFFMTSFWMEGSPTPRDCLVMADAKLESSWYLQRGDRTEGGFTVSDGNEEARFTVRNPYGKIIHSADVKGSYYYGFTAGDYGVYSFIFENLDHVNDEIIHVSFRSPYEPRLTVYDTMGLLMMLGSTVILFFGIRALRNG